MSSRCLASRKAESRREPFPSPLLNTNGASCERADVKLARKQLQASGGSLVYAEKVQFRLDKKNKRGREKVPKIFAFHLKMSPQLCLIMQTAKMYFYLKKQNKKNSNRMKNYPEELLQFTLAAREQEPAVNKTWLGIMGKLTTCSESETPQMYVSD